MSEKSAIYRRIILKISGESLRGKKTFGIDQSALQYLAKEIQSLVDLNVQTGIVIGGGNLFRGIELSKIGLNRVVGDHIGMLSTIINSLAMLDALKKINIDSEIMSSIPLCGICENYNWKRAINLLRNNTVVIFSSGTGNPIFTTDSLACLRGIETQAEIVLKTTKVDGVFSSDPIRFPNAKFYRRLSYQNVLDKKLKVMDSTAFTLARDNNLPIRIFNMNKSGSIKRIIIGEEEGTLISVK